MKKISLLFVLCASSLYVTAQTQKADKLQVNTTASIGTGAATTATVNIKGADALAASTALSVQNSASTTALTVNNAGQTLLGTATVPTGGTNAKLIIDNGTTNGAVQLKDGTQGEGKVLTSDANGKGTWQSPTLEIVNGIVPSTTLSVVATSNSDNIYTGMYVTLTEGTWQINYDLASSVIGSGLNPSGRYVGAVVFSSSNVAIVPPNSVTSATVFSMSARSVGLATDKTIVGNGSSIIIVPSGGQTIYLWHTYSGEPFSTFGSAAVSEIRMTRGVPAALGVYSGLYALRLK